MYHVYDVRTRAGAPEITAILVETPGRAISRTYSLYAPADAIITGVAVIGAWGGLLVGPPLFGALLQAAGSCQSPGLGLALTAFAAAVSAPPHPAAL